LEWTSGTFQGKVGNQGMVTIKANLPKLGKTKGGPGGGFGGGVFP